MANNPRTALHKRQSKDTKNLIKNIRKAVEIGTGLKFSELKERYSEQALFYKALKYVTTTKKAICKALDINIDNACRFKRSLERQGLLVQSYDKIVCPYSGYKAHRITTNENSFSELLKVNTNQLKMF